MFDFVWTISANCERSWMLANCIINMFKLRSPKIQSPIIFLKHETNVECISIHLQVQFMLSHSYPFFQLRSLSTRLIHFIINAKHPDAKRADDTPERLWHYRRLPAPPPLPHPPTPPTSSSLHIITHSHFASISFVRIRVPIVCIASHRIHRRGQAKLCLPHSIQMPLRKCRRAYNGTSHSHTDRDTIRHRNPCNIPASEIKIHEKIDGVLNMFIRACAFTWWSRYSLIIQMEYASHTQTQRQPHVRDAAPTIHIA